MPMDETLAAAAVDLSGRPYCVVNAKIKAERVGEFQVELLEDFFWRICSGGASECAFAVLVWAVVASSGGGNFKAFARHCDSRWRGTSG